MRCCTHALWESKMFHLPPIRSLFSILTECWKPWLFSAICPRL